MMKLLLVIAFTLLATALNSQKNSQFVQLQIQDQPNSPCIWSISKVYSD
jgi:hypothetical protein